MSWWGNYKQKVRDVIINNKSDDQENVAYWRTTVFCEILTYLTPLSLIALIPSVYMAFTREIYAVGIMDLFAFLVIVLLTVVPGIKLEIRKGLFIFILYCLSLTLLYFLPLPGPGILFLLVVTIFSSLIYSSSAAYISATANTVICIGFAVLIHLGIQSTMFSFYTVGSWIAVSSNLVLLSFACAKCLDLLLAGLTQFLEANKISEVKLERANRLFQFVSQINQTIVHVKDKETLFRKSCEIALEFGNYKMAWIGGFNNAQKHITLLDSCGIAEDDIKLFTHIPYETKAAQTHVLRTGTHFLCNDVETTLATGDWKPFAVNHSIGSFIVLPIKKSGSIFGTFNLYAAEPNYFGVDDIALLEEVTGDISFALDLIDNSRKQKEADVQLQNNFVELQAASNENSAILNTLPASIALIDGEGTILKVNEEWIQFGTSNGLPDSYTHLGKNYIDICEMSLGRETEDRSQMAQGLRDILSGNKDYFSMEYPCDSPTQKRWFKAEVRPFKSIEINGAVVMHIDITDRKMAETEMLLLINNTEEAFILFDSTLNIISFNNQFKNLYATYFGVHIQKGASILDYIKPDRKEFVTSIYKKVLDGHVETYEIVLPGSNHSTHYFTMKYSPARDDSGSIFGVFVTGIDITDKKNAEQQKEFERRNKEALINSTNDLIWSITKDYKLIAANNSFIEEIKKSSGIELLQGDDLMNTNIYPDELLNNWKKLYNRAHAGESFETEIYTPESANKGESWISISFSPILMYGEISGIACHSRNITERKIAENRQVQTSTALQHAVNDLNKIMDSSMDVICAVDEHGIFLKVSAASERVWGYHPEELIGTPIFNILYQDDLEKTRQSAINVMAGTNLNNFENRYVRKDGSLVPIEWTARWDAKDKIRYGVARDVSEKKRLRKAVENERKRFFDLFSEAPSSMGVLRGPDHVFELVNPLYLQLIGKDDIIGKTVKEVLPEAYEQGFGDILDDVYHTGITFSSSEMLIKLDSLGTGQLVDKYLNFMYQAHRTDNRIDGILFFIVDVTEQVVLRKKIEESESKLKQAQALLHICNWEIDMVTFVNTWSEECYKLLEVRREDVQPSLQAFLSMLHPEDYEMAKAKIEGTFHTYEAGFYSGRIQTGRGNLKYVYCEWKFEFDSNEKPIRLYGIVQDISERKIAELERSKITNDLIQRNRDLEQFTFIISHNLRAPAANIMGFTEYLQDETITPLEQKELLNGLSSSVLGLDTIIKDINSILQVKQEINDKKEMLSFSKIVTNVSNSIASTIDTHQIKIKTDFQEVDEFFSLKVYMHSIFYNLISNSIKYRRPEVQSLIEINSKKENDKIILIFKDNGMGIDMTKKGDKVFGLYQRFHNHVEGKGMGLFMVKTQVEAIGGKISVASELQTGSEFTIEFEN